MELILVELRAVHVLSDFVAYEVNGFPIGESSNDGILAKPRNNTPPCTVTPFHPKK